MDMLKNDFLVSPQQLQLLDQRILLEEYSTDSLENLMYSLCLYYSRFSRYPSRVTVVGFKFKEQRFTKLHRAAVQYPLSRFAYVGVDPPNMSSDEMIKLQQAEF